MRLGLFVSLVGALAIVVTSCRSNGSTADQCQGCAEAKAKNGWCDGCNQGFKPDGTTTKCKTCHAGANGQTVWCEGCKKGYVNGKTTPCKNCVNAAKFNHQCPDCKK